MSRMHTLARQVHIRFCPFPIQICVLLGSDCYSICYKALYKPNFILVSHLFLFCFLLILHNVEENISFTVYLKEYKNYLINKITNMEQTYRSSVPEDKAHSPSCLNLIRGR